METNPLITPPTKHQQQADLDKEDSLPTPNTTFELASLIANLAEAKKSLNTAILDVESISGLADFFVIATAQSPTQLKAICQHVLKSMRDLDYQPLGYEDDTDGQWHCIDFGDVVVHVMREDTRERYDLESFWNHGQRIPRNDWAEDDLPQGTGTHRKFA